MTTATPLGAKNGLARAWARDPLAWAIASLFLLAVAMPVLEPVFAALFPALDRPMYRQDTFIALLGAHVVLVAVSSAVALVLGVAAGLFITQPAGAEFRPLVETVVAIGQTVPPVAVLAVAAPLIGFGEVPALIALSLYGLLPILRGTLAGIESVSPAVLEAAAGLGLSPWQRRWQVELPLALPALLAGVRTSVMINVGTAAIASTVGARTLGSPIIVGLSGFNTAYVLQGALVLAALALVADLGFERLSCSLQRWRTAP